MAIAIATTSLVLTLVMGFLLYLEIHKMEKQVEKIQNHLTYLDSEISKLKQQAKKKYYSKPKKQVIQG
jgi:cell division protein FtsB